MSKMIVDGVEHINPLARFASYSYYHVLAVCNSSETADALANKATNVVDAWLHPTMGSSTASSPASEDMGRYAPKSLGDGLEYCILINGATDAAFTITRASFSTLAAAAATNNDRFTSLAVEGEIEISEPKGVTFMDVIVRCCVALGKDPAHVTFMLKTFFVGYHDDGSTETISNVAPISFIVIDATGEFTEAGGTYKLEFVCTQNGASRLPQFDKMLKMPDIAGNTLQQAVNAMQKSIDESYAKMYSCVEQQVRKTNPSLVPALKKVKYVIELGELYRGSEYKLEASSQQNGDKGTCDDAAKLSTGTDVSLESALQQMMQHCERVEKDSKEGITRNITVGGRTIEKGRPCGYKIHTSYTSKNKTDPEYCVTYRIEPFPNPRDLLKGGEKVIKEVVEPNTIHFEYMYTGKNVDILQFDMKMTMGLAYLMTAVVRNSYKDQGEVTPAGTIVPDTSRVADAQTRVKSSDNQNKLVDIPVFFGTSLDIPSRRSTKNPAATAGSVYNMTKHASVEVLDASMKITGNLLLLHSALQQTASSTVPADKPRAGIDQQPVMDWGHVPAYAKVNIRMPAHNDDLKLFSDTDRSFTQQFWYDYYYYILGVEHVFEDGEFTQNIEMIGMPRPIEGETGTPTENKDTFATDVADCFTNANKSCGSDGGSGGKVGTESTPTGASAPAAHDRKTVADSPAVKTGQSGISPEAIDKIVINTSPDNIVGWAKADPKVKQGIIDAVKGDRIPLSTYVAIASIESGGNPGARSGDGAAGIFQFVTDTWNSIMPDHKVTKQTPKSQDPRYDPYLNAVAARRYLNKIVDAMGGNTSPTWIYMGHNLGIGAGPAVKKVVDSGGREAMTDLYTRRKFKPYGSKDVPKEPSTDFYARQWQAFAEKNGYGARATTDDIRPIIAKKFQVRIKDMTAPPAAAPAAAVPAATAAGQPTNAAGQSTAQKGPANTAAEMVNRSTKDCKPVGAAKDADDKNEDKKPETCGDKQPSTDGKDKNSAPAAQNTTK